MLKTVSDRITPVSNILRKVGLSPLGLLLLILLALAPVALQNEFWTRLLIAALMSASLAMAFDFTAGYINTMNFGYAAFWGLGAYTSTILALKAGLSPWLGMIVGAVAAGSLGFLVGLLTLRLSGIFASCMTWFVALTMYDICANLTSLTAGNSGLSAPYLLNTDSNIPYFYLIFLFTVAIYLLLVVITKSHIGMAFKAIGQDPQAAAASGINITYYKVFNMTVSCAIAGLIGGFYAHFVGILTPDMMNTSHTVESIAISYIGGRGTIWGSLISAMLIIPGLEYMKNLMSLRMVLYGALMIMFMLFYPTGLAGMCNSFYQFIKRKSPWVKNSLPEKPATIGQKTDTSKNQVL
jgi:branched-chain amino acid transport system permease protein